MYFKVVFKCGVISFKTGDESSNLIKKVFLVSSITALKIK